MRRISKATYMTPEEIDARVAEREAEAAQLPQGSAKQRVLQEAAQLRIYADAKRWIGSPGLKPGA